MTIGTSLCVETSVNFEHAFCKKRNPDLSLPIQTGLAEHVIGQKPQFCQIRLCVDVIDVVCKVPIELALQLNLRKAVSL